MNTSQSKTLLQRLREESSLTLRALVYALAALLLTTQTVQAAETVTYYHYDALGSPVAATDASGNLVWREDYKPYGERIRHEGDATNTLWYTGKPEEAALGLQYFGARWYDPQLGRFTGIDPKGFSAGNVQSFNRYAYANNNPYMYVDPDGRMAEFVDLALVAGITILFIAAVNSSSTSSNIQNINLNTPPSSPSSDVRVPNKVTYPAAETSPKDFVMTRNKEKKPVGTYTAVDENDKPYHGIGTEDRMNDSLRRLRKENPERTFTAEHDPMNDRIEALKEESRRIQISGGPQSKGNENTYNKIDSPGTKKRIEAGDTTAGY